MIAHIGNIPVEEWLPFLVPVVGLYLYGCHRNRRRGQALARLPDAPEALDDGTIELVLARVLLAVGGLALMRRGRPGRSGEPANDHDD